MDNYYNTSMIVPACLKLDESEEYITAKKQKTNQNDIKLAKKLRRYARGIQCASDIIITNIETDKQVTNELIKKIVIALVVGKIIDLDNPLAMKVLEHAARPDYDFAEIACCIATKVRKRGGDKIEMYNAVISVLANRNVRSCRNANYLKSQFGLIAEMHLSNLDSTSKQNEEGSSISGPKDEGVEFSVNDLEPDRVDYMNGIPVDIKWSQLSNIQKLADNTHTLVYTAVFNNNPVVVKTINSENKNDVAKNDLEAELLMLSKLDHPNIVTLYGAGYHPNGCRFIIIEYCEGGSFMNLVGKNKCKKCQMYLREKPYFKMKDALNHARYIADAMSYLHGSAIEGSMILHRDLKPDNIGLTKEGTVKLLDFGLARIVENASPNSSEVYKMTGLTGTLCYMSPEVATLQPYNHKVDVFSFGVLLWQLVIGEEPYCCITNESLYRDLFVNNVRPPVNKKWPKELIHLMDRCWSVDIEERPAFPEVIDSLDSIITSLTKGRKSIPWARSTR